MPKTKETPKFVVNSRNWKLIVSVIVIVIVIIALVPSIYFYSKYKSATKNPSVAIQEQASGYVANLRKLIELPEDENPTSVATVTDKTKLKNQPFFANAENGDILMIFDTANKAILYRPSENKIINVMPISVTANPVQASSSSAQSSPAPTEKPKSVSILVLNGTKTSGLAATAEKRIASKMPQAKITKGDAVGSYDNTTIIDPTGNNPAVKEIGLIVQGSVAKTMPKEELPSKADIIIILGSDFK